MMTAIVAVQQPAGWDPQRWHQVMASSVRWSGHPTRQLTFAVRDTVNSGIRVWKSVFPLSSFGISSNLFLSFFLCLWFGYSNALIYYGVVVHSVWASH